MSVVRVEVSDNCLINRLHFYYIGLIGYGNCQMCMSVVRIEVSDIGLKVFTFWELLINFCYTLLLIPKV